MRAPEGGVVLLAARTAVNSELMARNRRMMNKWEVDLLLFGNFKKT